MCSPPLEQYVYSPLPTPTSIRLVKRLGKDEDGVIRISLRTIDLAAPHQTTPYVTSSPDVVDRPPFHCVSYSWGNPHAYGTGFEEAFHSRAAEYGLDNLFEINCDGKSFKIRKNLHDFLCQAPTGWTRSIRNRPNRATGKILLHDRATGHPAILHIYVGQRDDINALDYSSRTPLHYAAISGKLDNVKVLLKGGAVTDVRDASGLTAQDLAAENGHQAIVDLLKAVSAGNTTELESVPPFTMESPDDYIWIDAICIDQSNLEERASQVQIMNRIYTESDYLIIWLGEEDENSDAALSTMSKLVSNGQRYADSDLIPYREYNPERYASQGIPYISQQDWNSLAALFIRQWFRRIWVVQEAVYASAIVMYCGSKQIGWNDLEHVASIIHVRENAIGAVPSNSYIPLNEVATGIEYYFRQIRRLRETALDLPKSESSSSVPDFQFSSLFNALSPFRATDPRDKVYALFPLSKVDPNQQDMIPADYKISIPQCYANFTKQMIVNMGNLELLSYVHDMSVKKIDGLPSWVPDYSMDGQSPLFYTGCKAAGQLNERRAPSDIPLTWHELEVSGVSFDVVMETAAPRPPKLQMDPSWFDLLTSLAKANAYKEEYQSLGEVLWRTLCTDMDIQRTWPAPTEFGRMFKRYICAMVCSEPEGRIRQELQNRESAITMYGLFQTALKFQQSGQQSTESQVQLPPDQEAMVSVRESFGPLPARTIESTHFDCVRPVLTNLQALTNGRNEPCLPSMEEIGEYFASAVEPLRSPQGATHVPPEVEPFVLAHSAVYGHRRLFTTKRGYIGLGPTSVEVGDVIWLIPAFTMPVILRPAKQNVTSSGELRDEFFNFVGAAYVHGIRDGEAAKLFTDEDITTGILI